MTEAIPSNIELMISELARLRASSTRQRTQKEIVRHHRDAIIAVIMKSGASQQEVAEVLEALGEPVLRKGLFLEIRRQIGTMQSIRLGRLAGDKPQTVRRSQALVSPVALADLDDDFSSRRSHGSLPQSSIT